MSAKKTAPVRTPAPIVNRRARFDYELGDDIVAGLVLTGPEVRAARDGRRCLVCFRASVTRMDLWFTADEEMFYLSFAVDSIYLS